MIAEREFLLARRFLFGAGKHGNRATAAIIGIALSLVPLVVVIHVADGMIEGITTRFFETGTYHIQAIARHSMTLEQLSSAATTVAAIPAVQNASAERSGFGLLYTDAGRAGATIRALDPDVWAHDPGFRRYLELLDGAFDLGAPNSIVLGREIASRLDLSPGDPVRLLTIRTVNGGFLPRVGTFVVTGVFSTGYQDLDRLWAIIPISRGVEVLAPESGRYSIGVKVADPKALPNPLFSRTAFSDRGDAERIVRSIQTALGAEWRVFTWFELERSRFVSFVTTKNLLAFIMFLIVFVAAITISSSLVLLVLEKQQEIGYLKSTGVSPATIRTSFVFAGFTIGVFGAALGLSVGLIITVNVNEILLAIEWILNVGVSTVRFLGAPLSTDAGISIFNQEFYLETIPITVRADALAIAAGITIFSSTTAAFFPARRAAMIRPLEVLRRH